MVDLAAVPAPADKVLPAVLLKVLPRAFDLLVVPIRVVPDLLVVLEKTLGASEDETLVALPWDPTPTLTRDHVVRLALAEPQTVRHPERTGQGANRVRRGRGDGARRASDGDDFVSEVGEDAGGVAVGGDDEGPGLERTSGSVDSPEGRGGGGGRGDGLDGSVGLEVEARLQVDLGDWKGGKGDGDVSRL